MDKTIYSKTARGMREAADKTKDLSRDLRRVLKAIDGKSDVSALLRALDGYSEKTLAQAIETLVTNDFIRALESAGAPAPSKPITPSGKSTASSAGPAVDQGEELDFTSWISPSTESQAEAAAKARAEEQQRQAAAEKARREAEARLEAEMEAKARAEAATKAKAEAEAKARREAEEARIRAEAEAKAKAEAEAAARRKAAEEQARREAEEKLRREVEAAKAHAEAERLRLAAENERLRQEAERLRLEAEKKAQEAAQAQSQAEETARKEAEERARREAEEKVRREAEAAQVRAAAEAERQRQEAEERTRQEAAARAQREAEEAEARAEAERLRLAAENERLRQEAERLRLEAERAAREAAQARAQAEETARKEAEERARREIEEAKARAETERQAREAAAARARQEAEIRAQREAEEVRLREEAERLRNEAELREKAEQAMAEERVRREAEERVRREAAEQAEQEAAARAQREAEETRARAEAERKEQEAAATKVREEAAAHARREAEEQARRAAEEAMARAAAETERQRLEAESRARQADDEQRQLEDTALAAERHAQAQAAGQATTTNAMADGMPASGTSGVRRDKSNIRRNYTRIAVAAAVVALVVLHLVPFDGRLTALEQAASVQFGQPVKAAGMHFWLFPPQWRVRDVRIGDKQQIRVALVKAATSPLALFGDAPIGALELSDVQLDGEGLAWVLLGQGQIQGSSHGQTGRLDFTRVAARDVQVRSAFGGTPPFDAEVTMDANGRWQGIKLTGAERKFEAELKATGEGVDVKLDAAAYQPPLTLTGETSQAGGPLLKNFSASGHLSAKAFDIADFSGEFHEGYLAGKARLSWATGWSLTGEVGAKALDTTILFPGLSDGGMLGGKASFTMWGAVPSALMPTLSLDGGFSIERGALKGVDLSRLLRGAGVGSRTPYDSLSGQFVYGGGKVRLSNVVMDAGQLTARGNAEAMADKRLNGRFEVQLKSPSMTTKSGMTVAGTLDNPRFGN